MWLKKEGIDKLCSVLTSVCADIRSQPGYQRFTNHRSQSMIWTRSSFIEDSTKETGCAHVLSRNLKLFQTYEVLHQNIDYETTKEQGTVRRGWAVFLDWLVMDVPSLDSCIIMLIVLSGLTSITSYPSPL